MAISALHVSGNQILDASDTPWLFRGVNTWIWEGACVQGNGIGTQPRTQAAVDALKSWTNLNCVRIPFNENCWLGINGAPQGTTLANYKQTLQDFVALLLANDLYVILDLHWTSAPNSNSLATDFQLMPDDYHAQDLWTSFANTFKGDDRIIFDVFNEPRPNGNNANDANAWSCWKNGSSGVSQSPCTGVAWPAAGMQELVTTIRNTGATNILLVGGIRWSGWYYTDASSNYLNYVPTDPLNNLACSWHNYNYTWLKSISEFNTHISPVAAVMPVVLGEHGIQPFSGTTNGAANVDWWEALMDWADSKNIGYCAWVWKDWNPETNNGLLFDDGASGSYLNGTPSFNGQVYKDHIAALPPQGGGGGGGGNAPLWKLRAGTRANLSRNPWRVW
jgi:endoglucanase